MRADRKLLIGVLALVAMGCGGSSHTDDAQIATDAAVRVEAEGCHEPHSIGSGSFVAAHRVVTVAHVVAGATDIDVVLANGTEAQATLIAIDRKKDLAVLSVDLDVVPLTLGTMRVGAKGEFVAWRGGTAKAMPFSAAAIVDINAADIDHEGPSLRRGYRILAAVEQGDSGSVLVSHGVAVAVIFARSESDGSRAWATAITEAKELLSTTGDSAIDAGVCP